MPNKNQKIGRSKGSKDSKRKKAGGFGKYRINEPGIGPLTIFARTTEEAREVARRLSGLRRLVADLAALPEHPGESSANKLPGLFEGTGAERMLEKASREGPGLRRATKWTGGWQVWLN